MTNPYNAPTADLSHVGENAATYDPKMLSMSGRIGRLRYLAYTMVLGLLFSLVAGLLVAVLGVINPLLMVIGIIAYIPVVGISFVMSIRRLNDLDKTGWLCLLSLVPFVNILFAIWVIFFPGDKGENSYGPPPSQNSGLVIAGALILPIVFIIGILAAVAIPAYKDYTDRAKARQAAPTVSLEAQQ